MKNFEPRVILKLFFNSILAEYKKLLRSKTNLVEQAQYQEKTAILIKTLQKAYIHITTYNQSPVSAIEEIVFVLLEEGLQ